MAADDLIDEYLSHLRDINRSEGTIRARREMLRRHDRELPKGLDDVTEQELHDTIYRHEPWVTRDGRHHERWSPKTIATNLSGLASFYQWACRCGYLDVDLTVYLPRPRIAQGLPRPVEDDQLDAILRAMHQPYLTWGLMAAYHGMRCCEIAACDREDISATVTFVQGKGGRQRIVPTHWKVWAAVQALPSGPIARQPRRGGRASRNDVSCRAAQHLDAIGFPDVTLHRLRHWFGTASLEASDNLRAVQDLMGHASPTSTAVYTKVTTRARRAVVDALPILGGASAA